jgi:hypothetical protein
MRAVRIRFGQSPATNWQSLVVLVGAAFALLRAPVVLHISAEAGCACGEHHEEVTGVTKRIS